MRCLPETERRTSDGQLTAASLTPGLYAVLTCDLVTGSITALFLSFPICETGIVYLHPLLWVSSLELRAMLEHKAWFFNEDSGAAG